MPSKKTIATKTEAKKEPLKKVAKPKSTEKKPVAKAASKPVAKPAAKPAPKKAPPKQAAPKQQAAPKPEPKQAVQPKAQPSKIESSLMIPGAKFIKIPFFFDADKEEINGKRKYSAPLKLPEKPTACSRPRISGAMDSKNLVEILSQQLEYENKTYFEGCEGQVCVKCNTNNVDSKYYVDKSLGYCTECAMLLGLGQSKEGVFSDAQMELMRRSMEKSMGNAKNIDEDDIESVLGNIDSLEFEEEVLLAAEEAAEFNA